MIVGLVGCSNQSDSNDDTGIIIDCQEKKDCPNKYECIDSVCVMEGVDGEGVEPDGGVDNRDDNQPSEDNDQQFEDDVQQEGNQSTDTGGDGLGPELIVNGHFSHWTNDDPDSWILEGENGSDPMFTELSATCRVYSSGAVASIRQNGLMEVGKFYRLSVDILSVAEGGIAIEISGGGSSITTMYNAVGTGMTSSFTAGGLDLRIKTSTGSSADVTFDNVSLREILE
jgi:hypothetical protein